MIIRVMAKHKNCVLTVLYGTVALFVSRNMWALAESTADPQNFKVSVVRLLAEKICKHYHEKNEEPIKEKPKTESESSSRECGVVKIIVSGKLPRRFECGRSALPKYTEKNGSQELSAAEQDGGTKNDKRVRLWPNGVVTYTLRKPVDSRGKDVFDSIVKEIQEKTCVRFNYRDYGSGDYARVTTNQDYCHITAVGNKGGRVDITTGYSCARQHALIEVMHLLGFHHEFQRPDRDMHVIINTSNVRPERLNSQDPYVGWAKIPYKDYFNFGTCFDHDSVLTHSNNWDAIDGRFRTIIPIKSRFNFGNKGKFSPLDIHKINKLYKCSRHLTSDVQAMCKNKGNF